MSKTYSLLLNIKVDTNETKDGKELHSYSFKAWKDGKITKNARVFDWTDSITQSKKGKMRELGEFIFNAVQQIVKKEGE